MLTPRLLPRLAATIGLFTRYGLADFARDQGLSALGKEDPHGPGKTDGDTEATARAFRERLVELGPAYIKLGQVLATRSDLLPPAYIKELESLQDDVEPLDFAEVAQIIEEELGGRLNALFPTIDIEPLGTASLGQAHAATLRDGREVVVKVQRPNVRALLADDIEFFHELARFLTDHTAAGKRVDLLGILRQPSARSPTNSIIASRRGTAHSSAGAWPHSRTCSSRASSRDTPPGACSRRNASAAPR
jgi:hypothetical protein